MSKKLISVVILLITVVLALWQAAELNEEVIFPYVIMFAGAAMLIGLLSDKYSNEKIFQSHWLNILFFLILSASATAFIIVTWDFILFDDAGFLLRYLGNFADGHFYSFNAQDGPVFGISSFSYGLITGILCFTHLATPDQSITITSIAGLFVICFFLLKILRQYRMNPAQLLLSFLLIVFSSKFFLNSMTTGMETPVHLAIVMSAVYFFVKEKSSAMWLMLAISVISKLDAVPLAVTLGGIHLFQNKETFFSFSWKEKTFKEFILYAALPVTAWLIFAFAVFGSPLPQSAYSKIYFHHHADWHWFPFLRKFIESDFRTVVFYIFLALFMLHAFLVTRGKYPVRSLAFGLGFFSTMILYYFYNPIEQMTWYFAMPDLFMIAQTVISFYFITEEYLLPKFKLYTWSFLFIGAGLLLFSDTYYGRIWMKKYLDYTENERITIGKYLATITHEGDTLIAQHGHISRYTKAYVIDMTGLNSKLATQYETNVESVVKTFRPQFVITHGTKNFLAVMDTGNYVPAKSFYDISIREDGWPAWRIFKRNSGEEKPVRLVVPDDSLIKCYDRKWNFEVPVTIDKNVQIQLPFDSVLNAVSFGIKRKKSFFDLQVALYSDDRLIQKEIFSVEPQGHNGKATSRHSKEIIFTLNDESKHATLKRRLEITDAAKEEIVVIEPLYYVGPLDQPRLMTLQPDSAASVTAEKN